jgi:trehalose 6-phosphate phosphatase
MLKNRNESAERSRRPPLLQLANAALFLDVDGTLLEFAPTPMEVAIPLQLQTLLKRLRDGAGGALALVSGRAISTLDLLFKLPELPAAGLHGLERRDAGGSLHQHPGVGTALVSAAEQLAAFAQAHPGVIIENKHITLGLHYRAAQEHGDAVNALADQLEHALPPELVLQRGNKVIEIRPAGPDKGQAVNSFMAEAPFADRQPVFIGDDLTDEHAFEVINQRDGISIKVGHGASCGHYRLADPTDVRRWLWAIAQVASTGGGRP